MPFSGHARDLLKRKRKADGGHKMLAMAGKPSVKIPLAHAKPPASPVKRHKRANEHGARAHIPRLAIGLGDGEGAHAPPRAIRAAPKQRCSHHDGGIYARARRIGEKRMRIQLLGQRAIEQQIQRLPALRRDEAPHARAGFLRQAPPQCRCKRAPLLSHLFAKSLFFAHPPPKKERPRTGGLARSCRTPDLIRWAPLSGLRLPGCPGMHTVWRSPAPVVRSVGSGNLCAARSAQGRAYQSFCL